MSHNRNREMLSALRMSRKNSWWMEPIRYSWWATANGDSMCICHDTISHCVKNAAFMLYGKYCMNQMDSPCPSSRPLLPGQWKVQCGTHIPEGALCLMTTPVRSSMPWPQHSFLDTFSCCRERLCWSFWQQTGIQGKTHTHTPSYPHLSRLSCHVLLSEDCTIFKAGGFGLCLWCKEDLIAGIMDGLMGLEWVRSNPHDYWDQMEDIVWQWNVIYCKRIEMSAFC